MKPAIAQNSSTTINVIMTTQAILQDPIQCKGYQQFQVINLFLDTLVKKDSTVGIVSSIADRWDISQDQTQYTFYISDKAFFHNKKPITSADILYSMNRHIEKKSPSSVGIYLKNVLKKMVIINEKTVQFQLLGPYPPFLELLSMSGFGIVSLESSSKNIIGSGPYIFSEKKDAVCLEKNKLYKFNANNIDKYCFKIERDIDKTIEKLNTTEIDLAMGSPLEVALSNTLKKEYIGSPTFSLVTTNIFLNHNTPFLKKKENRTAIKNILYSIRKNNNLLTKYDTELNTFLPFGFMPDSYYKKTANVMDLNRKFKNKIRIIFPYGIFLQSTEKIIVSELQKIGFKVSYISVKGKELLDPILKGDFDLVFVPYQGVIADPDGYLDLLNPDSIFKKASLPTKKLFNQLNKVRFLKDQKDRFKKYTTVLQKFEKEDHLIPFSQNSIPIVYHRKIVLPNLNYSFHLNLRELQLSE